MTQVIRLATRKSPLAMRQAELAREHILAVSPDSDVVFVEVSTTGDEQTDWSLEKQGGAGLFTVELERVVRDGGADIGIHSAKDMPAADSEGLETIGYMKRDDVRDVLVKRADLDGPPAFIATGSPRRRALWKLLFPTAVWCETRGNVETRLKKVVNGKSDATFLAAAGLNRLGIQSWEGLVFETLAIDKMVPAAGQGAIALQARTGEFEMIAASLDEDTGRSLRIERSFLTGLGVGCHSAFAVHHFGRNLLLFHEDLEGIQTFKLDTGNVDEVEQILDEVKRMLKI